MYNIKTSDTETRKINKKKILTNFYNNHKNQFNNDLLIIDYSGEGTQFTENINFMVDVLTKLSNKKIICLSANYLSNSNNIKYYNNSWEKALNCYQPIKYNKNRKKNFILLSGHVLTNSRKNKLIILLYLFKEKILDKGIFSLTNIKNYNLTLQDHHISNKFSDLKDVEKKYLNSLKNISPKIIDINPNDKNINNQNTISKKMKDIIKDTNFHIILETEYVDSSYNLCRYTEKTTKILALGSPFIVFGCYKVLDLLKKDGFKTFSPFINEEYDLIDNLELRTKFIIKEINRLCELSQFEWQKIHKKMIDIQKHNIINLKRLINRCYEEVCYSDVIVNHNSIKNVKINKPINLGVLIYNNSYHKGASSNIGDYVQSLAAINIYRKIIQDFNNTKYKIKKFLKLLINNEIPNFNIIFIKRDNMNEIGQYNKQNNIITIMNGWWMHPCNENCDIDFDIPSNINPIFVSFHIANDKLLEKKYIDEIKKYEPIGCRDIKTTKKLKNKGVDSYFSGCLTTTIDFFKWNKQNDIIFNTDTKVKNGIYFSQANPKWKNIDHKKGLFEALEVLENYSKCKHVNTSRLHGYLPCLAMGVPVNFISPSGDPKIKTWGSKDRFEGLRELQNDSTKLIKLKTKLETKTIFEVRKQIKKIYNQY